MLGGVVENCLVSIGGHAYRADIRRGAYRFINTHLKNDPTPVDDSEVDLVTGRGNAASHPIAPERLRVFATDANSTAPFTCESSAGLSMNSTMRPSSRSGWARMDFGGGWPSA